MGLLPSDKPENSSLEVSDYAGLYEAIGIAAAVARSWPTRLADKFSRETSGLPRTTEAERLIVQRLGQAMFRTALTSYWGGKCCVSGLSMEPLLRASHIKPWAVCDLDRERLDVFNGLLLIPNLDALFDAG